MNFGEDSTVPASVVIIINTAKIFATTFMAHLFLGSETNFFPNP